MSDIKAKIWLLAFMINGSNGWVRNGVVSPLPLPSDAHKGVGSWASGWYNISAAGSRREGIYWRRRNGEIVRTV